ncbi:MAG: hypothetical protein CMH57_08775 [Myxococcales bacterium]|nr:hypothetical protein [Myxococcales bacterium]
MSTELPQEDLDTLNAQRAQLQEQIARVAVNIRDVVIKDIPRYLERETRWRWLQHTDFAAAMSDAQIRDLKTNIATLARELTPALTEALGDPEPWLAAPEPSGNKSLEGNPAVWAILQKIACQLSGLLSRFDFPTDPPSADGEQPEAPYHLVYRTPTYFLDGQYCPRLVENYWNHIGHLRKVEEAIEQINLAGRRRELEARWSAL